MSLTKLSNVIFMAIIAAVAPTLSGNQVHDCQKNTDHCDATNVVQGFDGFNGVMTNDPNPKYFCERLQKISSSEDGSSSSYKVVYRNVGCDDNPRTANATWTVVNKTVLLEKTTRESTVNELVLVYLVNNVCFVTWANRSNAGKERYSDAANELVALARMPMPHRSGEPTKAFYLVDNLHIGMNDDQSCYEKFVEYSGGKFTYTRDQYICKNIPPNP